MKGCKMSTWRIPIDQFRFIVLPAPQEPSAEEEQMMAIPTRLWPRPLREAHGLSINNPGDA
jgi:hypothetical protein